MRCIFAVLYEVEACGEERCSYAGGVVCVARLYEEIDETAVDRHQRIAAAVLNIDNITAVFAYYGRESSELTRLVRYGDGKRRSSAAQNHTARNYSVEDVNVDVAAAYDADNIFAGKIEFIKICGGDGRCSRTLYFPEP